MKIKIGIIEDQETVRRNLTKRFGFFDDIEIIFSVSCGEDAIKYLEKCAPRFYPDILLMDIELPGISGIEATAHIKNLYPTIDIMMQTVFKDNDRIFKSIQAGASGYLLKDDPIEKYVEAIKDLKDGGAPISASVAAKILQQVRTQDSKNLATRDDLVSKFEITNRELDILNCIIKDYTEQQIAEELFISPHTVRTHVKNIYKKLHVHSRVAAVKIALENGFMS